MSNENRKAISCPAVKDLEAFKYRSKRPPACFHSALLNQFGVAGIAESASTTVKLASSFVADGMPDRVMIKGSSLVILTLKASLTVKVFSDDGSR